MDTYEKKYNEAMLRADEAVQKGCLDKDMFDIIFPPEISEDERIRKELIEFIKWSVDRHFMREDFHQAKRPSEWIAYLEKQKEFSEHGYGLYYYHNGGFIFVACPAEEEKQKEQSLRYFIDDFPYSDEQKEQKTKKVLYIPKFRTGDLVRSSKNPRLTYKIFSVGSMNELGNSEYEVEIFTDRKPDEPRNLKHIEIEKMDSWGELVKQTPAAEWSEEEKDKLNSIERLIVNANAHGNYLIGDKEAIELQHFIRSIVKHTTNLAEWSEEDEKIRNLAIEWAETMYGQFRFVDMGSTDFRKIVAWLKSLRPSWKPSQEQMNCLCAAVDAAIRKHNESVSGYEPARVLRSLYEDLKKLM